MLIEGGGVVDCNPHDGRDADLVVDLRQSLTWDLRPRLTGVDLAGCLADHGRQSRDPGARRPWDTDHQARIKYAPEGSC